MPKGDSTYLDLLRVGAALAVFLDTRPSSNSLMARSECRTNSRTRRSSSSSLGDPARRWLHDGTIDWLWVAAEDAGVPIAALATDSLAELGRIAERHPGLRLTIDHWAAEAASPR